MTYDFIQNGLLLPTTMVLWIFSKLCKEFIHMILIQVSFEKGVKGAPKLFEKRQGYLSHRCIGKKNLNIPISVLHCHQLTYVN